MTAHLAPRPRGSERPLAAVYDVALLDLDGVIYLGGTAVPGAAAALVKATSEGMRLAYVTNNASRTPAAIAAQLASYGLPATGDDVITSAQAAARLLAERLPAGAPVLVVGGMGLRLAVRERGLRPVTDARERPAAVVQGASLTVSYDQLAEAALAIAQGAWYVAPNEDSTLPTPRGRQPGNGALIAMVATTTGQRPLVVGKPEPPLHTEAVTRTGARHPLVVGDRLDTDIEGATRTGTDSLLVLTGVTDPADVVFAREAQRPSYLGETLAELLVPHPAVAHDGGEYRCGGWSVACGSGRLGTEGELQVSGDGERLDGLRAMCAAVWSVPGAVPAKDTVAAALTSIGF